MRLLPLLSVLPLLPLGAQRVERAPIWASAWVNSARSSVSDGPVWLGRGVTLAASAGYTGRWNRISWSARPVVYASQNAGYFPSKSRAELAGFYNDPWYPGNVDRPYRFGADPFVDFDFGESFARADWRYVGAGISTAAQRWGPAHLQPLLLSGQSGGFPHAFVASNAPANIGIGTLSATWIVGRLSASGYGPSHSGTTHRLAVGATATWTPRGMKGLELGASRFFHLYDSAAVRDVQSVLLPVSGLLKSTIGNIEAGPRQYNQLANVFFRVAPPGSPIEAYGELLRDDHNANLRDAVGEPDHSSAWVLGLRRTVERDDAKRMLTLEFSNGRNTHLARLRGQASMYEHTRIVEGHTHRGMVLGAAGIMGGGGFSGEWQRTDAAQRSWIVGAQILRLAQDPTEGGVISGRPTGYYSLEVGRELERRGGRWRSTLRVEPGFGDVRGVNVGLGLKVTR